jgi:hypothetical protein
MSDVLRWEELTVSESSAGLILPFKLGSFWLRTFIPSSSEGVFGMVSDILDRERSVIFRTISSSP